MSDPQNAPRVSQAPTDPAFVNDPYTFYRHIRAIGDFVFWEEYDMIVSTTQVATAALLKHPKVGRRPFETPDDGAGQLANFNALEEFSLLQLEPPDHTHIRRAAKQGFDKSRIAGMAPHISRVADDLINGFPSQPFDFIKRFAHPFPAAIITRFFGLNDDMTVQMQSWSNDMVAIYQARRSPKIEDKADAAARDFAEYLRKVVTSRDQLHAGDFLSELIRAEANGTLQSIEELLSTVVLLLNAGHEASVHALGHAVHLLGKYPDRALALQPTNIAGTVEECLRFAPPLHMFQRFVYEDVEIEGQALKRGQTVGCLLGSACRDDAVWPDGNQFDPFRARRPHLAFGSGIHVCIGANLARLELQIALPAIFSRCPDLHVVSPPTLSDRYHFHGLEALMVDVTPATSSST
jgi:unspecific monooxygenase